MSRSRGRASPRAGGSSGCRSAACRRLLAGLEDGDGVALRARSRAAVRPAGPAPMTATSGLAGIDWPFAAGPTASPSARCSPTQSATKRLRSRMATGSSILARLHCGLAGVVADAAADAGERVALADQLVGLGVLALRDQGHVALRVDAGRAGVRAGRPMPRLSMAKAFGMAWG